MLNFLCLLNLILWKHFLFQTYYNYTSQNLERRNELCKHSVFTAASWKLKIIQTSMQFLVLVVTCRGNCFVEKGIFLRFVSPCIITVQFK